MNIVSSVNQLITSLEAFKADMPKEASTLGSESFDQAFKAVSDEISALTKQTDAATSSLSSAAINPVFAASETSFAALQSQKLLMDTQKTATADKPNMREFMDATGVEAADASELLYGVIGSNADLRNWTKIMASDNPVDAVRAATGQLYNSDKEYALVNHADYGTLQYDKTLAESSLSSKTVISQTGNFAEIETDADTNTTMAVSSSGLLLRGAGSTQAQIERTAWLFGFDTEGLFA